MEQTLTKSRFADLNLPPQLLEALETNGFEFMTPIQEQCLPSIMNHKDIMGQAKTGSGKTLAFLLATCVRLLASTPGEEKKPRAIMIAPTRELAAQIGKDLGKLLEHIPLTMTVVFGGVDYEKQRQQISSGVDIVVGTPGRLIDYYKQNAYSLKHIEVAVLDEADRMFDLGFIKDIRYLLRRLPPRDERQTLLFSATLSHKVAELAFEHMNSPVTVKTGDSEEVPERITQWVYYPAMDEKTRLLVGLLREKQAFKSIVFVNTKHVGRKVHHTLRANDFRSGLLSGDVPQNRRMNMLKRFADDELEVLVATDVAARGLHIPAVSHVFNYDLPQDVEDYIHRIGRTGRLGAEGEAISFACENTAIMLPDIEEKVGIKLKPGEINDSLLPEIKRPPPDNSRRRGNHQGNKRRPSHKSR